MILTGETEVLGEKHYTALVVDKRMSMEHWWNDTDSGKPKYWDRKLSHCNLSITNHTRTGLVSNPCLRGGRPVSNRLTVGKDRKDCTQRTGE